MVSISDLFGQAEDAAKAGMNDLLKQGANSGLGYLEQQAIETLQKDQAQHTADYQKAIADKLNAPVVPGSFSAYLSGITQGPIIQTYGIYILGAGAILVVATLMLRR